MIKDEYLQITYQCKYGISDILIDFKFLLDIKLGLGNEFIHVDLLIFCL